MRASQPAPIARKPLRTPHPGVNTGDSSHTWIGGPKGYCVDYDWKEWRLVVRGLTRALKERGLILPVPKCRGADHVDVWLEEVNYLIGRSASFPDGKTYELMDLEPGSDIYCILLCRRGYRIPKSAIWTEDDE